MSYAVFTDTSSNLPTALLDEKNVHVVPFSYYIDGEEQSCTDTAKFNGDEYYEKLRHGLHVTISAFAAAQSPLVYHFSMIDRTFCTKRDGMELTIAEKSMHTIVTGARTG